QAVILIITSGISVAATPITCSVQLDPSGPVSQGNSAAARGKVVTTLGGVPVTTPNLALDQAVQGCPAPGYPALWSPLQSGTPDSNGELSSTVNTGLAGTFGYHSHYQGVSQCMSPCVPLT